MKRYYLSRSQSRIQEVRGFRVELEILDHTLFCNGRVEVDEETNPAVSDYLSVMVAEAAVSFGAGIILGA